MKYKERFLQIKNVLKKKKRSLQLKSERRRRPPWSIESGTQLLQAPTPPPQSAVSRVWDCRLVHAARFKLQTGYVEMIDTDGKLVFRCDWLFKSNQIVELNCEHVT